MTLQSTSPVSRELEGRSVAIKVQFAPAALFLALDSINELDLQNEGIKRQLRFFRITLV